MLNLAYGVLAESATIPLPLKIALIADLSTAVGPRGLVTGQSRDLSERVDQLSRADLEHIHHQKTGVLFVLAVDGASRIAGLAQDRYDGMRRFAACLGLAFQAADDLIDRLSTVEEAGKDVGQDHRKPALVNMLDLASARAALHEHLDQAAAALAACEPPSNRLQSFVDSLFASLR